MRCLVQPEKILISSYNAGVIKISTLRRNAGLHRNIA